MGYRLIVKIHGNGVGRRLDQELGVGVGSEGQVLTLFMTHDFLGREQYAKGPMPVVEICCLIYRHLSGPDRNLYVLGGGIGLDTEAGAQYPGDQSSRPYEERTVRIPGNFEKGGPLEGYFPGLLTEQ